MHTKTIALDGDGVLLDYNLAYASAWERAFGFYPKEKDPNAYWALDRWDIERLEGDRLHQFRTAFGISFWESIPAMSGALEACHSLRAAGYTLVCVSALEERFSAARQSNLNKLGFPIERVIATGPASSTGSPKAEALRQLRPVAFVDDYLPYMVGIQPGIHLALILRERNGSPNVGERLTAVTSTHGSLLEFARWWTDNK